MLDRLKTLFAACSSKTQFPRNKARRERRLSIESLEARQMMTANLQAALSADGLLRVEGTPKPDTILIRQDNDQISVTGIQITTSTRNQSQVAAGAVKRIEVYGVEGNDTIRLDQGKQAITVPALIDGGLGNDVLAGSAGKDTFVIGNDDADHVFNFLGSDQLSFPRPSEIIKSAVRPVDGTIFELRTGGEEYANGQLASVQTADFAFDQQGREVWLGIDGRLQRFESGAWKELDTDAFKFSISSSGQVYSVGRDGWLNKDGKPTWADTADFAFDPLGRGVRLAKNGLLQRNEPKTVSNANLRGSLLGNSAPPTTQAFDQWKDLDTDVVKFQVGANGVVYSLGLDGWVNVDGRARWSRTADFALDNLGREIRLGSDGGLLRNELGKGGESLGWKSLDYDAVKFVIGPDDKVYSLGIDGWVNKDGVPTWSKAADFGFDGQGREILRGTGGRLQRNEPVTGWKDLDTDALKFFVGPNGQVYSLGRDGWVNRDGSPVWANTIDFAFDKQGREVILGTGGGLQRNDRSGWTTLDTDAFKFIIGPSGSVYSVGYDTWTNVDGRQVWIRSADFGFDKLGREVWLSTDGHLQRYESGKWKDLDTDAFKFVIGPNGSVYSIGRDGRVNQDGSTAWANVTDFGFDKVGREVLLSSTGTLQRNDGVSGWKTLDSDALKFLIGPNGLVYSVGRDTWANVDGRKEWIRSADIAFDVQGRLVWLGTDGHLNRNDDATGWKDMDTDATKFMFARDGSLYSIGRDQRVNIDGRSVWVGAQDITISQAGVVFLLGTNGILKKQTATGWQTVAEDIASFKIIGDQIKATPRQVVLKDGTLRILGTDGRDEIIVSTGGLNVSRWLNRDGKLHVVLNGVDVFSAARGVVRAVAISSGDGNDKTYTFGDDWGELSMAVNAGAGDDYIQIGNGPAVVDCGPGNDVAYTGSRGNIIYGGSGNDKLCGGTGNDLIDGGDGDDELCGGDGNDVLNAGPSGNDRLDSWYDGTKGNDTYIVAGTGWKESIHEYRIVHRARGTVYVREDNKGEDQLFWGVGKLTGDTGFKDGMDDHDFWSKVGGVIEVAGPAIAAVAGSVVTCGAAATVLGPGLVSTLVAGGLGGVAGSIAGQVGSTILTGRPIQISVGSIVSSFATGAISSIAGGLKIVDSRVVDGVAKQGLIDSALAKGITSLTGAVMSNVLDGTSINWVSIAGSVTGSLASGGLTSVPSSFTALGSQQLGKAIRAGVDTLAGGAVRVIAGGSPDFATVLLAMGTSAVPDLVTMIKDAVGSLFASNSGNRLPISQLLASSGDGIVDVRVPGHPDTFNMLADKNTTQVVSGGIDPNGVTKQIDEVITRIYKDAQKVKDIVDFFMGDYKPWGLLYDPKELAGPKETQAWWKDNFGVIHSNVGFWPNEGITIQGSIPTTAAPAPVPHPTPIPLP